MLGNYDFIGAQVHSTSDRPSVKVSSSLISANDS